MSRIVFIGFQPPDREYENRRGDYIRVSVATARLVAGHGIEGDRKAGHHPDRQVNVLSAEWLAARAAEGYRAAPGQFGEQIVVEGLAVETLPPGTRLALGEAVLEVANGRTGCERLAAAQGRPVKGVGPVGVMARVVTGATVAVGDPVRLLEPAAPPVMP